MSRSCDRDRAGRVRPWALALLVLAIGQLLGCAPEGAREAPRQWSCTAFVSGGGARQFRGNGPEAIHAAAAARALGDVRADAIAAVECVWPIDGPWLRSLRDPAATIGFLGRHPDGDLSATLDGRRLPESDLPVGAALPALLRAPQSQLAAHELRVRFEATGRLRQVGAAPGMWWVGELAALQATQRQYHVPDLASAVVLGFVALCCAVLALLLWRARSRHAEVFGWLALVTSMLALVRIQDNVLLPQAREGSWFYAPRLYAGLLTIIGELEAMRILTGLRRGAWFLPFYLAMAAALLVRTAAILGHASFIAVRGTNFVVLLAMLYMVALAVIAVRKRSPGYRVFVSSYLLSGLFSIGRVGLNLFDWQLPDLQPVVNFLMVLGLIAVALALVGAERRELVRAQALGRYVPASLMAWMMQGRVPVEERRTLTMFLSDLKGFTALSDRIEPEALAALLGEYLTRMADIAERWGGTVDKFVGDAVMVMFGAPDPMAPREGALRAVAMAAEMQHALGELNAEWRARGIDEALGARMGIHTGEVVVGELGSAQRSDYTVVGTEAGVAALLESRCPVGKILLSAACHELVASLVPQSVELEGGDPASSGLPDSDPTCRAFVADPASVDVPALRRAGVAPNEKLRASAAVPEPS